MRKYKISEVLDKKTKQRCEKFGYRIGRKCLLDIRNIEIGLSFIAQYEDGKVFVSTPIEDIKEDDHGVIITTKNRVYVFDNLYEPSEKDTIEF